MSRRTKRSLILSALLAGVLGLTAGLAIAIMPRSTSPPRTIVLVAEGMAFHLTGGAEPNPTLVATPGEHLELVLVQRDPGFEHDLALPILGRATPVLNRPGERATLRLQAPTAPGDYEYICTLHATLMRGVLRVR